MAMQKKVFKRKKAKDYILYQLRVDVDVARELEVLCAELGLKPMEFLMRLLRGATPDRVKPGRKPKED